MQRHEMNGILVEKLKVPNEESKYEIVLVRNNANDVKTSSNVSTTSISVPN